MQEQSEKISATAWAKTQCMVQTALPVQNAKSLTFLNQTKSLTSEVVLTIDSLAHGGAGVARHNDFVYFVPYTVPGDKIRARVLRFKKNYAEARRLEVLSPGPSRIKAPCPVFEVCGGCQWQNVNYSEQLIQKQKIVEHALKRIAKEEAFELRPILPSPKQFNYRNRAQVKSEGPKVG